MYLGNFLTLTLSPNVIEEFPSIIIFCKTEQKNYIMKQSMEIAIWKVFKLTETVANSKL